MAERLRRWTRNPMGFPRTGSNPVRDDLPFRVCETERIIVAEPLKTNLYISAVCVKNHDNLNLASKAVMFSHFLQKAQH